jgi:hypothetical protein
VAEGLNPRGRGGGCGLKPRLILGDASAQAGRIGIDGQREAPFKMKVALDGETERQRHRHNLGKAGRPHFGATETKVAQPEQGVAVFVQFGKQPSSSPDRIEEFDDRQMIATALAVGDHPRAQVLGEQKHGESFQNISI